MGNRILKANGGKPNTAPPPRRRRPRGSLLAPPGATLPPPVLATAQQTLDTAEETEGRCSVPDTTFKLESATASGGKEAMRFLRLPVVEEGGSSMTTGSLSLWHLPSKRQLRSAVESYSCGVVVTLLAEREGTRTVSSHCDVFSVEWLCCDFWAAFLNAERTEEVFGLMEQVVARLRSGERILLHCAAGIHRTGTMAYLILRELGNNPESSTNFLAELRPATFEGVTKERLMKAEVMYLDYVTEREKKRDF